MNPVRAEEKCYVDDLAATGCCLRRLNMLSEPRGAKQQPTVQERAVRAVGGLPAPLGTEDAVTSSSVTSFCFWCHSDLVAHLMPTLESPPPTPKFRKQKKILSLIKLFSSFLSLPCNFTFSHSQSGLKGLSFIVLLYFHINQWQINACSTVLNARQH